MAGCLRRTMLVGGQGGLLSEALEPLAHAHRPLPLQVDEIRALAREILAGPTDHLLWLPASQSAGQHGYDGGDLYISKVVEALQMCENDAVLLARTAGSEFAVFAHGFDNEESALRFAQDNRKTLLNTTIELPNEIVRIRASLGVAVYPSDAMTGDVLMNYASHAMFEVQNFNRGTLMEEMRQSVRILQQCVDQLPPGATLAADAPDLLMPYRAWRSEAETALFGGSLRQVMHDNNIYMPGDVYVATEAPKGELGFYFVSDGSSRPYRMCFFRKPPQRAAFRHYYPFA